MTGGDALRAAADTLVHSFGERLPSSIWDERIETGAALEWAMVAALAHSAAAGEWNCDWPTPPSDAEGFAMRNDIPMHHGARPGHAGETRLPERFLHAFRPKLIISRKDVFVSLFREGCAYHRISVDDDSYRDRADILLLYGRPTLGYPRLISDASEVEVSFEFPDLPVMTAAVAIVNAQLPHVTRAGLPARTGRLPFAGLIECSINKSTTRVNAQITRYRRLLGKETPSVVITGNVLTGCICPSGTVNLDGSPSEIAAQLIGAAELSLTTFNLV